VNAPAVRLVSVAREIDPKVNVPSAPVPKGTVPSANAARVTAPKVTVRSAPGHQVIGRPVIAPSVNAARVIAPKVIVPSVRVQWVTVRSASGARGIGPVAQDRHGMAHSVIRVNPVVGRQVVAATVIFRHRKRAPVIALPKLWRVRGFAHDAMRKHGFLKAA